MNTNAQPLNIDYINDLPDPYLFHIAREKVINKEQGQRGIGTLNEKTIHAILKNYYAPDESHQEIRLGSYVADILIDSHIFEIQSRNFNTMRKKLDYFLPSFDVTIIYPIAHTKWLCWIDEETGEISNKRKSPKKGTIYSIIPELYRIKSYLAYPNLHFILTFMDVEEYRLLNGWSHDKKRGSSRHDGIPTELIGEIHFQSLEDFNQLLPDDLPPIFTTKDYKKAAKVTQRIAGIALNILFDLGLVKRVGKKGNAFLYERQ